MPNKESKPAKNGAAYSIPDDKLEEFYNLYYNAIFTENHCDHLVEQQIKEGNVPLLVDIDLRYDNHIKERQYKPEDVIGVIECYLEVLNKIYDFTNFKDDFYIYIMEKENVNPCEEYTKDGVHIIFGINVLREYQSYIRSQVVNSISNFISIPNIKIKEGKDDIDYEEIFDLAISSGSSGWQLYGSCKPQHETYKLTRYIKLKYVNDDWEFCEDSAGDRFPLKTNFKKLTARNMDNPVLNENPSFADIYNAWKYSMPSTSRKNRLRSKVNLVINQSVHCMSALDIKNEEDLDKFIDINILSIDELNFTTQYYIVEIHDTTQLLSDKRADDYNNWLDVGIALKCTSDILFATWIKFSTKSNKFNYNNIDEMYEKWCTFRTQDGGLTVGSIKFWAGLDNPEEYKKLRDKSLDIYVDKSISDPTDYNLAKVIYNYCINVGHHFICISMKSGSKSWYYFRNHKWEYCDDAYILRDILSNGVQQLYIKKAIQNALAIGDAESEDEEQKYKDLNKIFRSIGKRLGNSGNKNAIISECKIVFYKDNFEDECDTNPYLMGFLNGVVDFKEKCFRNGNPDDLITKSTKIVYIYPNKRDKKLESDARNIMNTMFPEEELRDYMWNVLGAALMGTNFNQTMNIFIGSGSNGKSMFLSIIQKIFGQYHTTIPEQIMSGEKVKAGQANSDLAKLRGIRFAQVNEPKKGSVLNEALMKEITGGDRMSYRHLHSEPIEFVAQATLVVLTNTLYEVKAKDDGTWRRIRKVDFKAKFVDKIDNTNKEEPFQFLKDYTLEDKIRETKLVETFASMIVDYAFKNDGKVKDCDIVLQSSKNYEKQENDIEAFIDNRIIKLEGGTLGKQNILDEYKAWFEEEQKSGKKSKPDELYNVLTKKFGAPRRGKYKNITFKVEEDDYDEDEYENEMS